MEIPLRYGLNPHQKPARLVTGDKSPLRVVNGQPGYINIMDALTAWQLVRELAAATGKAAAASFKHVSPAGAAVDGKLSDAFRRAQWLRDDDLSPAARAYARARGADRMCSFGDAAAISETVDRSVAELLRTEVSDLVIAPGYEPDALEVLRQKKKGQYLVLEIDPDAPPPTLERRELFGMTLEQPPNDTPITAEHFAEAAATPLPKAVAETLVVATIALKYTQSNSVGVAYDGQVIGMAAGQQSRIHCTRLACQKAEKWMLLQHPRVVDLPFVEGLRKTDKTNLVDQFLHWDELSPEELAGLNAGLTAPVAPLTAQERHEWFRTFEALCLSSDAFIPFRDNIDRAARSNIRYVAHAGGAVRDEDIRKAAEEHGMVLIETGIRCFLH